MLKLNSVPQAIGTSSCMNAFPDWFSLQAVEQLFFLDWFCSLLHSFPGMIYTTYIFSLDNHMFFTSGLYFSALNARLHKTLCSSVTHRSYHVIKREVGFHGHRGPQRKISHNICNWNENIVNHLPIVKHFVKWISDSSAYLFIGSMAYF